LILAAPRVIRCFEFDKLYAGRIYDGVEFKAKDLESLQRAHAQHEQYFELVHRGVRFTQYVGVIQSGGLTIEILPKADKRIDPDKDGWQRLLKEMLHISGLRKVGAISKAQLKLRHHTLLDVYIAHFIAECEEVLRRGLVKTYRRKKGQVNALKGRLLFSEHIKYNLVRRERMFTEHQVYDYDHLVNHILKAALEVLERMVPSQDLRGQISRLLIRFPELGPAPNISAATFARINPNRKLKHYSEALGIAKLILLNYSPDVRRGSEDVLAILFDMNVLWELFIHRVLLRGQVKGGYTVSAQDSKLFWNKRSIRPDLVITWDDGTKVVIDTKWKLVEDMKPSDADLKQMFAYNLHWETPKSVLLYPGTESRPGNWGKFHKGQPMVSEPGNDCKVVTCQIWEDHQGGIRIKPGLAEELVDLFG
jgi:5-methylcytosine-specific restriction enzyme subunit McrC